MPPPSSTSPRHSPGRPSALPCPLIPLASPSTPCPDLRFPARSPQASQFCPRSSHPLAIARLSHPPLPLAIAQGVSPRRSPKLSRDSCAPSPPSPLVTPAVLSSPVQSSYFPRAPPGCPSRLSSPRPVLSQSLSPPRCSVARGPRSCLSSRAWSSLPPLLVPPRYATGLCASPGPPVNRPQTRAKAAAAADQEHFALNHLCPLRKRSLPLRPALSARSVSTIRKPRLSRFRAIMYSAHHAGTPIFIARSATRPNTPSGAWLRAVHSSSRALSSSLC